MVCQLLYLNILEVFNLAVFYSCLSCAHRMTTIKVFVLIVLDYTIHVTMCPLFVMHERYDIYFITIVLTNFLMIWFLRLTKTNHLSKTFTTI